MMSISGFSQAGKAVAILCTFFCFVSVQPIAGQTSDFLRKVKVREVEIGLQASLAELLGGASSASTTRRLGAIETSTWQSFQALPKNQLGRLAPPAVRYIVHSYFAKEHGWRIEGLDPHGQQASVKQVQEVSILQDKVPFLVENLLEARQAGRGLAHGDVVAMIGVLEQIIFDESITLLEAAYRLNGLAVEVALNESNLHRVLQAYLLLFGAGSTVDLANADRLEAFLANAVTTRPDVVEFENDEVLNWEYAHRHQLNPFTSRQYSFQVVSEIMEYLANGYGKWQNTECRDMKAHLTELDTEGVGRVPLGLFYAQPSGSAYHFFEPPDYLRKIGALDESSPGNPQVMIANYVAGPSNCIASSSYYSVCCLSECEHILSDLEHQVKAPAASADRLLTLVRNIPESKLPSGLPAKLHAIAARHGGEVPLHGRLFAQWLHFAFPRECPYPSVVDTSMDSAKALTPSMYLDWQSQASFEERQKHLASPLQPERSDFSIEEQWSDYEVLHAHDAPVAFAGASLVRTVVQIAAVCMATRSALAAWRGAASARDGTSKKSDEHTFQHNAGFYV